MYNTIMIYNTSIIFNSDSEMYITIIIYIFIFFLLFFRYCISQCYYTTPQFFNILYITIPLYNVSVSQPNVYHNTIIPLFTFYYMTKPVLVVRQLSSTLLRLCDSSYTPFPVVRRRYISVLVVRQP